MTQDNEWTSAHLAWSEFVGLHPELDYREGHWALHNFLRHHRDSLVARDSIRKAKGRHWIAHRQRFSLAAFDAATGVGTMGHVEAHEVNA